MTNDGRRLRGATVSLLAAASLGSGVPARAEPGLGPLPAELATGAEVALFAPARDAGVSLAAIEGEADPEWKSHFDLGGAASAGNTDTQAFHIGITTARETESSRTTLDTYYNFSASNGDRDGNRLTLGGVHDWLMPESRWFWFADARFDYDEFQSWEYRISGHVGPGYELIKRDDFTLNLRAGIGFVREFHSPNTDWRPEALAGFDLVWQITERQKLEAGATIYPDLDDTGEFRTLAYAGWTVLVDPEVNMSFRARVEDEYQSKVAAGREHNDLRATIGLQFDF